MANYKQKHDLYWTQEGDFVLSEKGDLEDTKNHAYRGFIQQVLGRVMSSRGDWPLRREIGASIGDFLGHPNTRATAEQIRTRILSEFARGGLVTPSTAQVDIVPITGSMLLILILITPPGSRQSVFLSFSYNMADNKLVARNA